MMTRMRRPPTSLGACVLAFLASFCVMVVELVAGRLIAKHVGFSLYTWTSVIGVVLSGVMIGNLLGGRLADRFPPRRAIGSLFLIASAACAAIPLLDYRVGDLQALGSIESWPLRIALHVVLVFLVPATALGLIGPVVAKMAIDGAERTGRAVGNVYGWGAFGSIAGTFATGFVLIGRFGTIGTLVGVAVVLALIGLGLLPKWRAGAVAALVLAAVPVYGMGPWMWTWHDWRAAARLPCPTCRWVAESDYSFLQVADADASGARMLTLDNLVHAYYQPDEPDRLKYEYERTYAAVTARARPGGPAIRTFFIGGGGYTFPRYVHDRYPGSVVDVAEIDPLVTRADEMAFGLDPALVREGASADLRRGGFGGDAKPGIDVFHLDARNAVSDLVLARQAGHLVPFDAIYGDAFNYYAVPFHLGTREFDEHIRALLDPVSGVYLINVIDIFAEARFLGAMVNTIGSVFPHVYVIGTGVPTDDPNERDTFVVVGSNAPLDLTALGSGQDESGFRGVVLEDADLAKVRTRSRGLVLTDDFSPVETLLYAVVHREGSSHQDR